jgi:hypothetical protein
VGKISKVEISLTSSAAVILKISLQIFLAAAAVAAHVKDKIYKPRQQLPLKKRLLAPL